MDRHDTIATHPPQLQHPKATVRPQHTQLTRPCNALTGVKARRWWVGDFESNGTGLACLLILMGAGLPTRWFRTVTQVGLPSLPAV